MKKKSYQFYTYLRINQCTLINYHRSITSSNQQAILLAFSITRKNQLKKMPSLSFNPIRKTRILNIFHKHLKRNCCILLTNLKYSHMIPGSSFDVCRSTGIRTKIARSLRSQRQCAHFMRRVHTIHNPLAIFEPSKVCQRLSICRAPQGGHLPNP